MHEIEAEIVRAGEAHALWIVGEPAAREAPRDDELYRALFEQNTAIKLLTDPETLRLVDEADRKDIATLFQYGENTVGALMTTDYAWLPGTVTAAEAIERIVFGATPG